MKVNDPQNYDSHILNDIDVDCSEMNEIDKKFLNGVIRQVRPKKILEVGVAAGNSSVVILNAIKDIEGSLLYSIDYNEMHYNMKHKETGFIVKEKYPNLMNKYKLYTGGVSAKFLDEIGNNIDLCLLDTAHSNPGEFLDFLMVLPFLKRNAIIIIHDVCFHTFKKEFAESYTCGVLFSCIDSKQKIIANDTYFNQIGNIGMAVISDDIYNRIYDYFHLLTLPWKYLLSYQDISIITNFLYKHYDKKFVELFKNISLFYNNERRITYNNVTDIYNNLYASKNNEMISNKDYQKLRLNSNWFTLFGISNNDKYLRITLFGIKFSIKMNKERIDKLAWWIPVRKWRDNFRNKFFR